MDIACGHEHSVACDANGRAWAWGHPNYGQLGTGSNGSFIKVRKPVDLSHFGVVNMFMFGIFVLKCLKLDLSHMLRFVFSRRKVHWFRHINASPHISIQCRHAFLKPIRRLCISQLGNSATRSQDGGKGAAVQYRHVHLPRAVDRFLTKDAHHKMTHTHPAEVRFRSTVRLRVMQIDITN